MTFGGYISLLASLAGVGVITAAQDPTFESPTFTPLILPDAQEATGSLSQGAGAPTTTLWSPSAAQKRVSVHFEKASPQEVIDWLTKQGVSFVTSDSDFPSDKRITLNVVDQPIADVAQAIAAALGGHWESRGNVMVFRKGGVSGLSTFGDPFKVDQNLRGLVDSGRGLSRTRDPLSLPQRGSGPSGLMSAKDWEEYNKSLRQRIGSRGSLFTPGTKFQGTPPNMDPKEWQKINEAARKDIEKSMEHMRKSMEEMHKSGAFDRAKMTEKDMELLRKSIEQAHKSGSLDRSKMQMSEKEMERFHKDMENMHKELERELGSLNREQHPFMDPKAAEKMAREMQERARKQGGWQAAPGARSGQNVFRTDSGGQDLLRLGRSLSPDQKEKHRRQGYLNYSDLTPSQQKYLGRMSRDGNWTLRYSGEGHDFTIKSDR
jgi:hypothetical protein